MRGHLVIVLVLAALLSTGCGALSHTLTAGTFGKRVLQRLDAVAPDLKGKLVKPLLLRLPGREGDISLQSLYSAVQAGGNSDQLIDDFVGHVSLKRDPIPLSWTEAKGYIVPLLVGPSLPPAGRDGLITVPWDAGLQVLLGFDGNRGVVNLIPADLKHWGVTVDQAYATALQNLRESTAQVGMQQAQVGDPKKPLNLFVFHAGDGLDASRLLLVDEWRHALLPYIDWDMVVVIPSRDVMYAFDGGDKDWVTTLQGFAKSKYASDGHPVSDQLYAFHDGHLVVYQP